MSDNLKITVIQASEIESYDEDEGFSFKHPSKFYFVDALGQYIYVHTRDRQKVVEYIKENYGGRYIVRTAKESKGSGNYTCTGTTSRRGTASHLKKTN